MKYKTAITKAISMQEAALEQMLGTWNKPTQQLIRETFETRKGSNKTGVYTSIWNEATEFTKAGIITVYVQVFDSELELYQVTSQY